MMPRRLEIPLFPLYRRALTRTERRAAAWLADPSDRNRQLLREAAGLTNRLALAQPVLGD